MTTDLGRLCECRECREPIRFVLMEATGRAMPVNPKPEEGLDAHGTVVARVVGGRLVGFVMSREHQPNQKDRYRFRAHWSTCTRGRSKKEEAPTPAADAPLF